jgi:hypothetical protein
MEGGGESQRLELRKRRDIDDGRGLEQLSKVVRGFGGTTFRISGNCRRDNFCRPIEGETGGEAGTENGENSRHPRIRDPQQSEDSRKVVTHCKHGGSGAGDRFCPPILGEVVMFSLAS